MAARTAAFPTGRRRAACPATLSRGRRSRRESATTRISPTLLLGGRHRRPRASSPASLGAYVPAERALTITATGPGRPPEAERRRSRPHDRTRDQAYTAGRNSPARTRRPAGASRISSTTSRTDPPRAPQAGLGAIPPGRHPSRTPVARAVASTTVLSRVAQGRGSRSTLFQRVPLGAVDVQARTPPSYWNLQSSCGPSVVRRAPGRGCAALLTALSSFCASARSRQATSSTPCERRLCASGRRPVHGWHRSAGRPPYGHSRRLRMCRSDDLAALACGSWRRLRVDGTA